MPEHKVQVSAKDRNGLIIVVAGESVEEMYRGLTDLYDGSEDNAYAVLAAAQDALRPQTDTTQLNAAIHAAQQGLGATVIPPPTTDAPPARNFRQRAAEARTQTLPPPLSSVTCKHGSPAKIVPAGNKNGKDYGAFYACPLPRESQCDFRANVEG